MSDAITIQATFTEPLSGAQQEMKAAYENAKVESLNELSQRGTDKTVTAQVPEVAAKKEFSINEQGLMTLGTLAEQMAFAKNLMQQGMVSNSFKTPQQVVLGIQYSKALGIDAIKGLKMMYVVNGRPCLYGEGPLLLCQSSGLMTDIEEFYLNEKMERICVGNKNLKDIVYAAVTRVERKGHGSVQEDYFTLDDLAAAGIDQGKNGRKEVWDKWERIMLRYKARALALRTKFADCIGGVPMAEYDEHFNPDMPDIIVGKPKNEAKEALEKAYGEAKADQKPQVDVSNWGSAVPHLRAETS